MDQFERSIFAADLPPKTTNEMLENAFAKYGVIEGIHIKKPRQQQSLQHARIQFAKQASAEDAYSDVDDIILKKYHLTVSPYRPNFVAARKEDRFSTIVLKLLNPDITAGHLKEFFCSLASVFSAKVHYARASNRDVVSRGFALVQFMSPQDVEHVLETVANMQNQGQIILDSPNITVERRVHDTCSEILYVRNLHGYSDKITQEYIWSEVQLTREVLIETFSQIGPLISVSMTRSTKVNHQPDENHQYANYRFQGSEIAFVCFANPGDAQRAVHYLKNRKVNKIVWYVALTELKDHRAERLQGLSVQRKFKVNEGAEEIEETVDTRNKHTTKNHNKSYNTKQAKRRQEKAEKRAEASYKASKKKQKASESESEDDWEDMSYKTRVEKPWKEKRGSKKQRKRDKRNNKLSDDI